MLKKNAQHHTVIEMKIIILGNGFDLSSTLPTSYEEFFDSRFTEIDPIIREIKRGITDSERYYANADVLLKDEIIRNTYIHAKDTFNKVVKELKETKSNVSVK